MDRPVEFVDYELFAPSDPNDLSWHVRILTGDFVETVIRYNNIVVDGINECIKFNFDIIFSPIVELATDDADIQHRAGEILNAILEEAAETGSLETQTIFEKE
jgi:hypothetical protein